MSHIEVRSLFRELSSHIDEDLRFLMSNRPLLAHYTSIETFEKIFATEEILMANPLFMNDLQEVRFIMLLGRDMFHQSVGYMRDKCGIKDAHDAATIYHSFFEEFDLRHAFDTYVFCLTEHDKEDNDGALSMWRGYGSNGNGVALVFNTGRISYNQESPFLFTKVRYGNDKERLAMLQGLINTWWRIFINNRLSNEHLHDAVYSLFNSVKLLSLTSKHHGFREEREWRVIYMPDRDTHGILDKHLDYKIGRHGIEPRLRLKITPLQFDKDQDWSMSNILQRIILGPSISSPISKMSVERMLKKLKKPQFTDRLFPSTIPLRPT